MSEVASQREQMIERAEILGASDKQIAYLQTWDDLDESVQEMLWRSDDAQLKRQLLAGQEMEREERRANSSTPVTDAAVELHGEVMESQEQEDWELLALNITTILDVVSDDPSRAIRLFRLEETADRPRKGLMSHLEKIGWPGGRHEVVEGAQVGEETGAESGPG